MSGHSAAPPGGTGGGGKSTVDAAGPDGLDDDNVAPSQTYHHKFPGGFRCAFLVNLTITEMDWSPGRPPRGVRWMREYYRWRDQCLEDFAQRTGVLHVIAWDDPHTGVRVRHMVGLTRDAAYRQAAATRNYISGAQENQPGAKREILQKVEQHMLDVAPPTKGGSA
jgi:hypothetical protein